MVPGRADANDVEKHRTEYERPLRTLNWNRCRPRQNPSFRAEMALKSAAAQIAFFEEVVMNDQYLKLPSLTSHRLWLYLLTLVSFTAALGWVGVGAMVLGPAGNMATMVLLVFPPVAAIGAYFVLRRYSRRSHVAGSSTIRKQADSSRRLTGGGKSVAILASFTAIISWIGAILVLNGGGSGAAIVLLVVPAMATAGTYLAFRGWRNSRRYQAR